jgi:hypothetical protein
MSVKKKEYEKLDSANIVHVIKLMEQKEKPISKKEACAILHISYNTARLSKIIEEHLEYEKHKATRKAENKGKAATQYELATIAQDYIEGANITKIAARLYRSSGFVKAQVEKLGLPIKHTGEEKRKVAMLPDQCISMSFSIGEKVWSAVYNGPAEIRKEILGDYEKNYGSKAYRMYVFEKSEKISDTRGGFYAVSAAYDIGSLKHLEEYGIRWDNI